MIIRLHVRVSGGVLRLAMTGLLLAGSAGELCSEPVTMTSYYPAPSGVYSQMVATQNSYLARDLVGAGNTSMLTIGGGNFAAPVASNTTKMLVLGGNVGIGLTNATSKVQVTGVGGNTVDAIFDGKIQTGDASQVGGIWFMNSTAVTSMRVGQNNATFAAGSPAIGLFNNNNWGLTVDNRGFVGFANSNPAVPADVGGVLIVRNPCASEQIYAGGTVNVCGAGTYITWATGLYTLQQTGAPTTYLTGQAYCCPVPVGGAIF